MREGLKDRPLAALLLARVMERMALQEGDLERLRLAREHKARAQQRLLESQNSVQTSTKLPDLERFDEPSPGRLFIDDFLDKNLVEFDECSAHYESMTPVELVDEMTFLFGRQTLAIRFELSSKRYYAFLDSLVHCAANNRDLTNHQRSQLVNMAIDVRAYVRNRTAEDWREAFDKALSASLDHERKFGLFPIVSDLVAKGVRDYAGNFHVNPVGEILSKREGTFAVPNDQVPGLLFNDGPESAEAIRAYLRIGGDPLPLEDYGAYLMRQSGAVRDDGTLDLQELTAWENRYRSALSVLPGLQKKLDVAREAQEALEKVAAEKRPPWTVFVALQL